MTRLLKKHEHRQKRALRSGNSPVGIPPVLSSIE